MNRMIKYWFMHPFTTLSNSAIKLGNENESHTSKVLHNYLRSLSKSEFRGGKIREHVLLVNKRVRLCATSPDGIISLYRQEDKTNKFTLKKYRVCITINNKRKERVHNLITNTQLKVAPRRGSNSKMSSIVPLEHETLKVNEITVIDVETSANEQDKRVIEFEDDILCDIISRYYLQKLLRSSNIPETVKPIIHQFYIIQNVSGDGNCSMYNIMNGLYHNGIEFNEDVNIFRR